MEKSNLPANTDAYRYQVGQTFQTFREAFAACIAISEVVGPARGPEKERLLAVYVWLTQECDRLCPPSVPLCELVACPIPASMHTCMRPKCLVQLIYASCNLACN